MRQNRSHGLDELMIVNPGPSGRSAGPQPGEFFLGEDGTLYQLQGTRQAGVVESNGRSLNGFFLGDDGNIYLVGSPRRNPALAGMGAYEGALFLGDDGSLYQIVGA